MQGVALPRAASRAFGDLKRGSVRHRQREKSETGGDRERQRETPRQSRARQGMH